MTDKEYKDKSKELPVVSLAFKCPIPNLDKSFGTDKNQLIQQKLIDLAGGDEWPTSSISNKKLKDVFYIA